MCRSTESLRSLICPWCQRSRWNILYHLVLCLLLLTPYTQCLLTVCRWNQVFELLISPWSRRSRSNILNNCLLAHCVNSPYIFSIEIVHISYNDCLLCIDDNACFRLPIWPWSQRSRPNIHNIRLYPYLHFWMIFKFDSVFAEECSR